MCHSWVASEKALVPKIKYFAFKSFSETKQSMYYND